MAAKGSGRRRFGSVRRRESGRWQARYRDVDGQMRPAPHTFATKRDAEQWLSVVETQLLRSEWIDPHRGDVPVGDYVTKWIVERAGLRPRTRELYRWLLARHIEPHIGRIPIGKLTTERVREWRAALLAAGVSHTMTAKAYRLLRAALTTAVEEDGRIAKNPCRVRGADKENAPTRPVLTVPQVFELAGRMRFRRFRVLVLLAAFATLRWGEVTALRRCDVAADGSWVRVSFAHTEVKGEGIVVGPPKSQAGVRTVSVPTVVRPDVVQHLAEYVDAGSTALVFTGPKGAPLRRGNFNTLVRWTATVTAMGMTGLHFHDLRHTGNFFAAQSGVSTADLMARMGHDDVRAALLYQLATSEAGRRIADSISDLVADQRGPRPEPAADDDPDDDGDDGAAGALVPAG